MAGWSSKRPKHKFGSDEFLAEISGLAEELRAEIEAAADLGDFDRSEAGTAKRKARVKDDFGFFCRTYFPHYGTAPPSRFHQWMFENLPAMVDDPRGRRQTLEAPRGNAKSTYGTQLFPLWCYLTGRKRNIVIISDAIEVAAQLLEGIKSELETNPRLAHDWPKAVGAGQTWQVDKIVTRGGAKFQCAGARKRLRGTRHGTRRPDLVVLDDLENDENVRSPEQRDKTEVWIDRAVEPLGPPDGSMDLLYVGTVLHYDAVLARKSKNPSWRTVHFRAVLKWPDRMDLWETWEETYRNDGEDAADEFLEDHRAEMLAGAEVLWPEVQPFESLMKIRLRIGTDSFNSEYQNDPTDAASAIFADVTFWVNRLSDWTHFGAVDPSLGKSGRRGDPSAILVGGYNRETGVLDVIEASIARRKPELIIATTIAYQREYRCLRWAVESVQFQEFFRAELVRQSAAAQMAVPAVPYQDGSQKELRIAALEPHVSNGLIRFHPGLTTLLAQLRHWPAADHDDGPDALVMLWWNATTFAPMTAIRTTGQRRRVGGGGISGFTLH